MKLLLTGAFKYNEHQLDRLNMLGYETIYVHDERVSLQMDVSDIDAVVCNGLFLYNDINKFKNLKFIQLTSAGLDRVPIDYIEDHGISLFSARGVYSIPMAEWVVLKILEVYKKSRQFYVAQRNHKWEKHQDLLELTDKTATIIGLGSVGIEIAKRLKAFGVNVIGVGRRDTKSEVIDEYYKIEHIDDVIRKSDIIILTLALTKETHHLIDTNKIARMKDDCVLINVSRGGILKEEDLLNAIQGGKFLGVALDVFEEEPLPEKSLMWNFENVIISPHNSFVSDKVNARLFKIIEANLKKEAKLNI